MAEAKKEASSTGPILAIGGSVLMPIIFSIILFVALAGKANGTSAMQPINPAPGSPEMDALQQIAVYSNPDAVIAASTTQLSSLAAQLQTLSQSKALTSAQLAAVKPAQQDIQCIMGSAATDKNKANGCAKDFVKQLAILETSSFSGNGDIVATAKEVVNYNNPGGHITSNIGKILYVGNAHGGYTWSNGYPDHLDCSDFVSFVIAKAGYWASGPNYFDDLNTTGLFTESASSSNIHHLTRTVFTGSKIPKQDILAKVADGTIKPGDIFLAGPLGGISAPGDGHTYLYIGGDPNGDSIASSNGRSLGGPQFKKLNHIQDNVVAVLRVTGAPTHPTAKNVGQ